MAISRLTFGEWTPDQPALAEGIEDAKNVIAQRAGYGPFPSGANVGTAYSSALVGLHAAKAPDGTTTLFGGTSSQLLTFNPATASWAAVNSGLNADRYRFTTFGNRVIAASIEQKLKGYLMGSSTTFSDLAANAPQARHVTVVRDFVVAADIKDGVTNYPNRVQWSGLGDETVWNDVLKQADYQDVADGGRIQGITGGEFGTILTERTVTRMTYVGTPFVFQFDVIDRKRGCMEPGSVAQTGNLTFFLSDDGFCAFDGQQILPIGAEKVDRYFFRDVIESYIGKMWATVDPVRKIVIWAYPGEQSTGGNNKLLIYNYVLQRWSYGDEAFDVLASAFQPGVNLDQMDAYGSIDSIETTLDDRSWAGGKFGIYAARGGQLLSVTGAARPACVATSEINNGGASLVTMARPLVDGGSATVEIASRMNLGDEVVFGPMVSVNADGRAPLRSHGRYHRVCVTPTGEWTNTVGVDVELQPAGVR